MAKCEIPVQVNITVEDVIEWLKKDGTLVPVVRCKECKHWMDIDDGRQKHEMCAQLMPDWFCADGKRRTE